MKVLFVADDFTCDPLGIAWLSAYLKDAGHETDIATPDEARAGSYEPDILCYSVTTGNHIRYMQENQDLRFFTYPNAISVFGGPHVTFFPDYIDKRRFMDVGVRGEGFGAIVDVANAVEHGGGFDDIPNCVVNGKANPLRPLKDKADLLLPDRDIIYRKNFSKPIKSIMASFGCPMSCQYCYNDKWKKLYKTGRTQVRPVADVMAEIADLRRYPIKLLYFEDDVFPVYDKEWLDEFCATYDKALPFHIHLRVEYIKDDTIQRLKSVGLHSVTYAIESGDDDLRRKILKRRMTRTSILAAARVLRRHGVNFRTQNMVGIPYETWETALKTLFLNIECKPTMGWASVYQPYPGTELGDLCIENGWFEGDLDSISSSFFDKYRLDVPHGKRYERLQKLFGFAVRHPRLGRAIVPWLAKLPFSYKRLHNRYKKRLNRELYQLDL